jgi:hypothetical protein
MIASDDVRIDTPCPRLTEYGQRLIRDRSPNRAAAAVNSDEIHGEIPSSAYNVTSMIALIRTRKSNLKGR